MKKIIISFVLIAVLQISNFSQACTNFLITKGASADGSTLISYSADSHQLFGELYFKPAKDYPDNTWFDVTEWDTGKPLGKIKQVKHTYYVVGNMNEHQLTIGETTFGGRDELQNTEGIVDYGSLIYLTLQRAKTAREAIKIMTELVAEYGYYSTGESFSIGDPNEVWIMEMIGKGKGVKGANWVAIRIPDGYVSAHANQSRITTFAQNDPKNCLYSKDIIAFARSKGYFKGKDKDFSFSDAFAEVNFGGARFCDARAWSFFKSVCADMGKYESYANGKVEFKDGFATNRMPLWVKPDNKIKLHDVMNYMRDHYEGTSMDMTKDIGAGPWELPYRWRKMTWKVDGHEYCHERAIATQQTGFSYVAQCRSWLPNAIGGILWFGVDDANTSVYVPMYCGITAVPKAFAEGNGDMLKFTWDAAFWVFNWVSNYTYSRYSYMIKDVRKVQTELETNFIANTASVDQRALDLYKQNPDQAIKLLTGYSVEMGAFTHKKWKELGEFLMVKYIDGNIKKEKEGVFERTEYGQCPSPDQPGYPEWWLKKIAETTGDKLKVIGESH